MDSLIAAGVSKTARFYLGQSALHAFWSEAPAEAAIRAQSSDGQWLDTIYRGIPVLVAHDKHGWELRDD